MTTEEISEILKLHKAWINGEKHGKRGLPVQGQPVQGRPVQCRECAIYAYGMPG